MKEATRQLRKYKKLVSNMIYTEVTRSKPTISIPDRPYKGIRTEALYCCKLLSGKDQSQATLFSMFPICYSDDIMNMYAGAWYIGIDKFIYHLQLEFDGKIWHVLSNEMHPLRIKVVSQDIVRMYCNHDYFESDLQPAKSELQHFVTVLQSLARGRVAITPKGVLGELDLPEVNFNSHEFWPLDSEYFGACLRSAFKDLDLLLFCPHLLEVTPKRL